MSSRRSGHGVDGLEVEADVRRARLDEREPVVRLGVRPGQRLEAVDGADDESIAIGVDDRPEPRLDRAEVGHQYAASLRMPSAIFSGLTMNQSSRTWLYGTPGTSGPAIRVTGPSR